MRRFEVVYDLEAKIKVKFLASSKNRARQFIRKMQERLVGEFMLEISLSENVLSVSADEAVSYEFKEEYENEVG